MRIVFSFSRLLITWFAVTYIKLLNFLRIILYGSICYK
ncbi:hypothetical protein Phi40:1_gp061 [Cellulophaga phage phi40:1]|uniref:Uncharacterized protein n=1 Tax=Cellulophaga phage phi38:1 TaxID=1327977 RepID=R9ZY98_9CAUD|nr:hypothetical protein Phi38:1_gp061 [Cellulophaga phage phi38:1]AGO47926.1 hypothetical protein Phi40:1_gp061 [Cellulophaga phage phi40:1]AGO48091.1 hypothetical protein Phi38:1_gp061 [Cellulophaga phage phi38:1]